MKSSTSNPTSSRASKLSRIAIFTFQIREGHKWSDGSPLTPEDFRYCWEDVWLNEDLTPGGPAAALLVDGKPPLFEIVDLRTVRYSWEAPNPDFLPSLAAAQAAKHCGAGRLSQAVPQEVPGAKAASRN